MKILIADEKQDTCDTIKNILENLGHEIISCRHKDEITNAVSTFGAPDCLVVNKEITGTTGLQVYKDIRNEVDSEFFYTILLSPNSKDNEILEALKEGIADYITTPINYGDLRKRVINGQRIVELKRAISHEKEKRTFIKPNKITPRSGQTVKAA